MPGLRGSRARPQIGVVASDPVERVKRLKLPEIGALRQLAVPVPSGPLAIYRNEFSGKCSTNGNRTDPVPGVERGRSPLSSLLWFQHVVLVDPAASKEAMAHHVLANQKNDDYQDDQQKELYNS